MLRLWEHDMAGTAALVSRTESAASPLGRVRWTVCAMLFLATSINYIDRQVIAILKPALEHSIGGGWLPAPFHRLGLSSNCARLAAMLFCACLVVPIYTASSVKSMWTAIAMISMGAGGHQGWSANLFTTSSDMFPHSALGSVVGIGRMAGSDGSALFAFFAGHILRLTHSYASLFGIAASAYLLALVILYLPAPGLTKVESLA